MEIEPANVNAFPDSSQKRPPSSEDAKEEIMLFLDESQDIQALGV